MGSTSIVIVNVIYYLLTLQSPIDNICFPIQHLIERNTKEVLLLFYTSNIQPLKFRCSGRQCKMRREDKCDLLLVVVVILLVLLLLLLLVIVSKSQSFGVVEDSVR